MFIINLDLIIYPHHKNGPWANEHKNLLKKKCVSKRGIKEKVNFADLVKYCYRLTAEDKG